MRANFAVGALLCLVAWSLAAVHAQDAAKPAAGGSFSVESLAWMAGGWRGELEGRRSEEHWTAPHGGIMTGMFRTDLSRGPLFELMSIEREGDDVILRLRHFQRGLKEMEAEPLTLRLASAGGNRAEFQGTSTGAPKRIVYEKRADGQLAITVESANEQRGTFNFLMKPIRD